MLLLSLSRLILGMTVSNIFLDNLFNNILLTNFMLMLFSIEKRIKVASNYSLRNLIVRELEELKAV